jgi:hypothetical protein
MKCLNSEYTCPQEEAVMGGDKWEEVGPGGGLGDILPGPMHTIVRNTETGEAREVYHDSGQDVGDAIAQGQFTDRDVSACDKK